MSMSDPELDDTTSAAKTGSLGSLKPKSLGSLVQSARGKELNRAKWILIVVGLLYVLINGLQFVGAEGGVDEEIQKQLKDAGPGAVMDPNFRDTAIANRKLLSGAASAVGLLLLIFGLIVKRFPVPVTTMSLVLFIGLNAVLGYLAPTTLVAGLVLKVIFLFGLVKALQAALAAQKDARLLAGPA